MPEPLKPQELPPDTGSYLVIDNETWRLYRHSADFTVEEDCETLQDRIPGLVNQPQIMVKQMATKMCRVSIDGQDAGGVPEQRDALMKAVRQQFVAHHIYQVKDVDQEI